MTEPESLIPLIQFCESHRLELTFIMTLHESGLIEIITEGETLYVHAEKIPRLEKIIRLHLELDINLAGIEAISHLLERIEMQQQEIADLRNQLRRFG